MTHSAATRAQPDADATFEVGQLVRVRNPNSPCHGMTGTLKRIGRERATVHMTAWSTLMTFALADLVAVERGAR